MPQCWGPIWKVKGSPFFSPPSSTSFGVCLLGNKLSHWNSQKCALLWQGAVKLDQLSQQCVSWEVLGCLGWEIVQVPCHAFPRRWYTVTTWEMLLHTMGKWLWEQWKLASVPVPYFYFFKRSFIVPQLRKLHSHLLLWSTCFNPNRFRCLI